MKYLVIEDEPLAAEKLVRNVQRKRPAWEHLHTVGTVREAVQELLKVMPDFLFLDIHLSDGISFQIFDQVEVQCPVIFTTAYDQYALRAFKVNSIDYLLKPLVESDLDRALQKLESRPLAPQADWKQLETELRPRYKDRFLVSTGERIRSLQEDEVAFFFAQGKHSFITDVSGNQYLYDQTLTAISEQLDPRKFFQINRQYVIHINSIREMIPYSKGRLKLVMEPATPEDAIVSVDKSPRFKGWVAGE
ncbi:MAG TPA: DNA-binding response regulator [Cryomorphaceae bacterium]|nr:DNA-binding response regulator [Owenweeksia sp.]MBF99116.1 DNA-binding response regulator [Owenweeksia sp.]HAD97858.1 DNA-binding response regulator [Cryomorphaceae bacterium]HBF20826.1 DNA-binding response regulator [Cryomorphaceae bacterium]HCQ16803.1 DNA-binding response regulator [Cryomorphaceae bacterium]|tara:strand:+ start:422 stop:1165 length:744 start_codon:yes stop_codon:yes gene_type:complete